MVITRKHAHEKTHAQLKERNPAVTLLKIVGVVVGGIILLIILAALWLVPVTRVTG
jgi:CHASE3 domain sensor protein